MVTCASCHAEMPVMARICPHCGARRRLRSCFDPEGREEAPPCPRCHEPVRRIDSPREQEWPGYANPPWNAGWDGVCEDCGHDFRLTLGGVQYSSPIMPFARRVTVAPASIAYRTSIDSGLVLAGIVLTVDVRTIRGERETETLHLTMGEVETLLRAFAGEQRLYFEQDNWNADWT